MYADGASFVFRARVFHSELKANRYPTAGTIAERCRCSRSTAHRVINRLREEYGFPVEWDDQRQGYRLTDPTFQLETVPPGKDELSALILMRILASPLRDEELERNLDSLWAQYQSASPKLIHDLALIPRYITSDSTAVSTLADIGLLELLGAATRGEDVEIQYQSPWRHPKPKIYRGRIERLHYSDDMLYLLFLEESGRRIVLSAASVQSFTCLKEGLIYHENVDNKDTAENWLEGFGIWAGAKLEEVEIQILPPASQYYSKQIWHDSQEDSWEGEILVRRMNAIISPELVRRVLSLGRFVKSVRPEELVELIRSDLKKLLHNIG